MKKSVLILFCLILGFNCKKDPPVVPESTLSLAAVDASCTEAWLQVTATELPATIRVVLLGPTVQTRQTLRLISPDSLLVDEGLLPKRTYTYQLHKLAADSTVIETSASVQVATMDTTSHNWNFMTETLGTHSSTLHDVAIINDTLVYAVGEVYHSDSSQSFLPFPVASWDGHTWLLKRVYYNGTNIITAVRGIWVSGPNDIWLAAGSVFHWDGTSSQAQLSFSRLSLPDPNATIEKLWGSPEVGLYGVGNAGTIVHRDISGVWQHVESGTTVDIKDVWGSPNRGTKSVEIACIASYGSGVPQARKLIGVSDGVATMLPDTGLPLNLDGLWFKGGTKYYLTGSGLFQKPFPLQSSNAWVAIYPGVASYHTSTVRGTDINDVFHAGHFGELLHFNGRTYVTFRQQVGLANGVYRRLSVQANWLIAVGHNTDRAVVLRGTRTN